MAIKLSPVQGNTTSKIFADFDIDDYTLELTAAEATAIKPVIKDTIIKTQTVTSGYYQRLDATMPAVSFVSLTIDNKSVYFTNDIPPKYMSSFSCTRISNDVGKFTLELQQPVNTFKQGTDEQILKLISILGQVYANYNSSSVQGYPCELQYGWRGYKGKTTIHYKSALVLGMTVNYSDGLYTYTISGTVNDTPENAFKVNSTTILTGEQLAEINTSKLSDSANNVYDRQVQYTPKDVAINKDDKYYTITLKKGTKCKYTLKDGKRSGRATEIDTDITFYNNPRFTDIRWSSDYSIIYPLYDDTVAYLAFGAIVRDGDSGIEKKIVYLADDNSIYYEDLDLTKVRSGQRISDLVEILANYIFGNLYEVEVAHCDRIYDEDTSISSIVKGSLHATAAKADEPSYTINEHTTSLYTWLVHMIRACQDDTEYNYYSEYSYYDTNCDGMIDSTDLAGIKDTDTESIYNRWKKFNLPDDAFSGDMWTEDKFTDEQLAYTETSSYSIYTSSTEYDLNKIETTLKKKIFAKNYPSTLRADPTNPLAGTVTWQAMSLSKSNLASIGLKKVSYSDNYGSAYFYVPIDMDESTIAWTLVADGKAEKAPDGSAISQNAHYVFATRTEGITLFGHTFDTKHTVTKSKTIRAAYSDYETDYYALLKYNNLDDINDLLEDYDTNTIRQNGELVQYAINYIDAVAGQSIGKIYIGPTKATPEETHQYIVGNKNKDSVVLSFSLSEDLVYLISATKAYISANAAGLYGRIDANTGEYISQDAVPASTENDQVTFDNLEDYAMRVANAILEKIAKGHLTAKLSILSDATSRTLQVTDYITVLCTVNGGQSMFSGTYMVSGITDTIDSNGRMTSDLSLQFTQSSAYKTVSNLIVSLLRGKQS